MSDNEYYDLLKRELIPELLSVIEAHGVDVMHAKHIPGFLQKGIDHSIFEQSCIIKFKAYPYPDR